LEETIPIQNDNTEYGSELDVYDKCFYERVVAHTQQLLGDYHVTRAAYGKEFRYAFYNGNDDGLKNRHGR
jgi:hypothetical protein